RYPLLAESRAGYQNLCRLITRMKLRAKKGEGAATPEEFAEFAEGLICLAPTLQLQPLLEIFGPRNVYAQLQRHMDREQEARNHAMVKKARRLKIPLLATNGAQYARADQREILDIPTCVRNKAPIDTAGRLLARNSERRLKSPVEMARLFADLPEAIANT